MHLLRFWNVLSHFLTGNKSKKNSSNVATKQGTLYHKLNNTQLDDDEVKCLQAYITTILAARNQNESSQLASTAQPECIVFDMAQEEFREFVKVVGGNDSRLVRVLVQSSSSLLKPQKLTIFGENGLHVFNRLQQLPVSSEQ